MQELKRTNSSNMDFQFLVNFLDQDLKIKDGDDHAFYAQYNKSDNIQHVIIYYSDNRPIGCGAIKPYETNIAEIKRMFVMPASRGQGIALKILYALEAWAKELNFQECILETGKKQIEALKLYPKAGYTIIPNYGQYQNMENSVCMKKTL